LGAQIIIRLKEAPTRTPDSDIAAMPQPFTHHAAEDRCDLNARGTEITFV
jgi:hypothetical protein